MFRSDWPLYRRSCLEQRTASLSLSVGIVLILVVIFILILASVSVAVRLLQLILARRRNDESFGVVYFHDFRFNIIFFRC